MTGASHASTPRANVTDVAGAVGAIVAALCCAGTPIIVAALAAAGLSALRKDTILWPVMLVSLAVAIWGSWQGHRKHSSIAPLVIGTIGAVSLPHHYDQCLRRHSRGDDGWDSRRTAPASLPHILGAEDARTWRYVLPVCHPGSIELAR